MCTLCLFQMTIYFTCESSLAGPDYSEVIINRSATVEQCLQCILLQANIKGLCIVIVGK